MDKDKAVTPLVEAYDEDEPKETPGKADTDAPVSTDEKGEKADWPDLGGRID